MAQPSHRDDGRVSATHSKGHQVANAIRYSLPLLPEAAADAATYPMVHAARLLVGPAYRIVAHPAEHVSVSPGDEQRSEAFERGKARQS